MSDQPKPIEFQQGGKPANASPTPEPGTPGVPVPLTLDQVRRVAEEVAENKFRQTQRLIDKADTRITKKVREELKTLEQTIAMQKQIGIEVPPDKVNQMQQQIIARAYSEPEATQPPAPSGNPPTQAQYPETGTDPVTAAALRIMQHRGVTIEDNDPEVSLIDQSDPDLFLASIGHAVEVKRARLGAQPKPVTPTNAGSAGSPQGLEQQYKAELKKVQGNPTGVAELKNKYRKLGLTDLW